MRQKIEPNALIIPEDIAAQWQNAVDIVSELAGIPAGLIMRVVKEDIEVFLSSHSQGNPYQRGDREHLVGSGLYCETVIGSRQRLLVPDALADPNWESNPDVKLNMISYLGFPILLPDNTPFGTICILDNHPNTYSETIEQLLVKLRDLIQSHLELIYMNTVLGDKHRRVSDYLGELQSLRGIISICCCCKKIKTVKGSWEDVERYLINHPEADFSHGYCPECGEKAMAELNHT